MLKRLETDKSLSAFAGQFVPLKLTTDGNPEWSKWARKFPHEGNGIPILYIIRADGKKLYARSGALPGKALPQMLFAAMKQSGRIFSDGEARAWETSVTNAQQAMQKKDLALAAKSLAPLKKFGSLNSVQSFSKFALRAKEIAADIEQQGDKKLQAAIDSYSSSAPTLDAVYTLVASEASFASFPKLKAKATQALGKIKRNQEWRATVDHAKALHRARTYLNSTSKTIRKRAAAAFEGIIRKYPDTPVSEVAKTELKKIDPASSALTQTGKPQPAKAFREWTDATGKFKTTAKLVSVADGKVTLLKKDGQTITLPISRLSAADQKLLRGSR